VSEEMSRFLIAVGADGIAWFAIRCDLGKLLLSLRGYDESLGQARWLCESVPVTTRLVD